MVHGTQAGTRAGQHGEERGSSPFSSPGTGKADSGPGTTDSGTGKPGSGPGKDGQPDRFAEGWFAEGWFGEGWFAEGGPGEVLVPGAVLAARLAAVTGHGGDGGDGGTGLGSLDDREVLGVVAAGARMAAWAGWVQLRGLAEFARRRPAAMAGSRAGREAAEEAGWVTGETWTRMLDQLTRAATLAGRLPRTLEAMAHGQVSDYKARIIEGQTAELSDADVAKADVILAAAGRVKNPAGLRDFARRQVMRLDPDAAERRRVRARQDAHVRLFQEDSGNAGLSARELPAGEAVIAWQNIERRALGLHAAGIEGTAGQLQVQATLDFLLGRAIPGQGAHSATHNDAAEGTYQGARPAGGQGARQDTHNDAAEGACQDTHGDPAEGAHSATHDGAGRCACQGTRDAQDGCPDAHHGAVAGACAGTHDDAAEGACQGTHPDQEQGACRDARPGGRGGGRGGWSVNPVLLVPWDPSLGGPSGPAELPGFGLVGERDTMDLLAAAGDDPATRWCVTVQGQDAAVAGHGCAPGRRTLADIPGPGTAGPGAGSAAGLAGRLGVSLTPVAAGACEHAQAEPGYVPSRQLRHLVRARTTRCAAPGCARPAAACDLDHTVPWDDGGLTCQCNLSPLCRVHHQVKQARGWTLEQPEPGVLVWTSPSGLTRTTTPG